MVEHRKEDEVLRLQVRHSLCSHIPLILLFDIHADEVYQLSCIKPRIALSTTAVVHTFFSSHNTHLAIMYRDADSVTHISGHS